MQDCRQAISPWCFPSRSSPYNSERATVVLRLLPSDIHLGREGEGVLSLTIVAAELKKLTVVNTVGDINLGRLSELQGRLGIPRMDLEETACDRCLGTWP